MVQSAQANVKRLEDLESFKRVYAPFSGVITARNVDIGTLINAGNGGTSTKEMFDLAQTDPLRVYVSVPQSFSPSMREGLKACLEMTEYPGEQFCGKVVRTSDAIDPTTRTLLTEVDVPNPKGILLQGSYAQVHFDAQVSGQRLSLPINALLFRPEGTMAAVLGPDNVLSLHKLTIGRDLGNSVEVLEGITAVGQHRRQSTRFARDGRKGGTRAGKRRGRKQLAIPGSAAPAPLFVTRHSLIAVLHSRNAAPQMFVHRARPRRGRCVRGRATPTRSDRPATSPSSASDRSRNTSKRRGTR